MAGDDRIIKRLKETEDALESARARVAELEQRLLVAEEEAANQQAISRRLDDAGKQAEAEITELRAILKQRVDERTEAPNQTKDQIEAILNHCLDGVALVSSTTNIQQTNSAFNALVGCAPGDCLGHSLLNIIHPDDQAQVKAAFQTIIEEQSGQRLEIRLIRRNNMLAFQIEISIAFVPAQGNQEAGLICILRDITRRKQAERKLRLSEQQLREAQHMLQTVLDTIPVGVFWKDPDSVYLGCNRLVARDAGLESPAEIVGKRDTDLIWSDLQAVSYIQSDRKIIQGAESVAFDSLRLKADGSLIWAITTKVPLRNPEGEITGILGTYMDITQRKRIEDALRQSEERLRILFETMPDIIILMSEDGTLQDVNPAMLTLSGFSREEIIGKPLTELSATLSKQVDRIQEAMKTLWDTGLERLDVQILGADNSMHTLEVLLHPTHIEKRKYILALARDITLRKHYEETLERALAQERELGQLKSRFISIAAHEFRTPLAVIMSSTEMMIHYRARMSEQEIESRLEKIQEQVNQLTTILGDVLELEGMRQGRIRFNPVQMDPDKLCRDILEEFRATPGQAHELIYHGPAAPQLSRLDWRLMRQIFTNLLSNAIKYSSDGNPIWVDLTHTGENDLVLRVRDQGIGIPAEAMTNLFEAFHRAENVINLPGYGLGLSIVKEAVELHGGTITVESVLDAGTTFTVTLPSGES